MDGDVLYVASGSESTINMFDLANNLTLLGPFVVFSELFYLVPTFTTLDKRNARAVSAAALQLICF
jgi:hypothetical protein